MSGPGARVRVRAVAPIAALALGLAACAPDPLAIAAEAGPAGVTVTASAPVERVAVRDAGGAVLLRRDLPGPSATVALPGGLPPGTYTIAARAGKREATATVEVAARAPVRVEVQAAPGQAWVPGTGEIEVPVVAGGMAEVAIGVVGGPGMPASVDVAVGDAAPGDAPDVVALVAPGRREVRAVRVAEAPVSVRVGDARFTLRPRVLDPDALRRDLALVDLAFPTAADGLPDLGRPAGRVVVPAGGWEALSRWVGLGGRRRDPWAPWAWQSVGVRNAGADPVDVVLELEVLRDGAPAAAFRPRLRDGDGGTGTVAALLRVPAGGEARAALPVFVDTAEVADGAYDVRVRMTPLGAATALSEATSPLYVSHGDPTSQAGFLASLGVAGTGAAWSTRRLRGWLEAAATSELMTIALFGSALFLVGTASDLLAMAVGAVLGPFSTVVTGLLSDVARTTLLATLVALHPRAGTLTLAMLTGALLRGFTTGSFAPADVLYTFASVGWGEAFAWLAGLTRGGDWRDEPPGRRWARLSLAFGGAAVCTTLGGLWIHVVLFRLFFAPWYVAFQVLVPGLLYTVLACRIATGFADGLRRVSP